MHAVTMQSTDAGPIAAPKKSQRSNSPILVVDDSRASQRVVGDLIERGTGRPVAYAKDGCEALSRLEEVEPCIVLTDLHMPEMSGFELVEAIRAKHPRIPVILMTAYGSEDAAMHALEAGAAYYVPKKNLLKDLVKTLQQLLAVVEGEQKRREAAASQTARASSFEIANDPELLPSLIDLIKEDLDAFAIGDETARIRIAVALQESLANALYHGNLECSSDLRQDDERVFYRLAEERRAIEPYRSRRIYVTSKVDRAEARIVIRDEGPGFNVASLDKPFDPEDLMRIGGRGMILIRTFMDEAFHNGTGNQITLVKRK